jgi:hypothetical protein
MVSALDRGNIAASRVVGSATVYRRDIDGRPLTFISEAGAVMDSETRTSWNVFGQGIAGPLAGRRLMPIVHSDTFWFAWYVFQPGTRVWGE